MEMLNIVFFVCLSVMTDRQKKFHIQFCKNVQTLCRVFSNHTMLGVGWVSFFLLGSGFGFFDFARVGSRVLDFFFGSKEKFLGSLRVKKIYVRVKLGSKIFAFLT